MDTSKSYTSLFFSFSPICLALAMAYFSYAVLRVVQVLPVVLDDIQAVATIIDPVVEEVAAVTGIVPGIVEEVGLVREQIPPILAEVAAVRAELPALLAEIEQVRLEVAHLRTDTIPPVLAEVASVRTDVVPPIVTEMTAYRETVVPDLLVQIEETREMVPTTLDRVDGLIDKASVAGKQASEGAVTGMFTGLIKAPFAMMSGLGGRMFKSKEIGEEDIAMITEAGREVLSAMQVGSSESWSNPNSGLSGSVTLRSIDGDSHCRTADVVVNKNGRQLEKNTLVACLNKDGEWSLKE